MKVIFNLLKTILGRFKIEKFDKIIDLLTTAKTRFKIFIAKLPQKKRSNLKLNFKNKKIHTI
jgi:hypothetical protein